MFKKKILVFITIIFFVFITNSNSFQNKILFKIENQIITSLDVINEYKYLIALNFLHDFDLHTVSDWLNQCIQNNKIQFFILDEIKDRAYQNNHNFKGILPKSFLLVDTIGEEYRYNRSIKVFKNLEITS